MLQTIHADQPSFFNRPIIFFDKYLLLKVIGVNFFLFAAFLLLTVPGFETNDDNFMMLLVNGSILDTTFDFTVNTHLYYGKYLSFLYALLPEFNWYMLNLIFFLFWASVSVWYVVLSVNKSFVSISLLLLFFLVFITSLVHRIQYSSTGAIVGITGILLWVFAIKNKSNFSAILSAVFILISGLLRWQVFILVIAFFIPVALFVLYKSKKDIKYLMPIIVGVAIFFVSKHFEMKEVLSRYGKPNYIVYHSMIEVVNNPKKDDDETLKKIGFTKIDINLMNRWYWMDPLVFTKDKLVQLGVKIQSVRTLREFAKYFTSKIFSERYTILVFILFFLSSFILIGRTPSLIFWSGLSVAVLLFLFLCFTARVHHRVTVSFEFYIYILLLITYISKESNPVSFPKLIYYGLPFAILLSLYLNFKWIYVFNEKNISNRKKDEACAKELFLLKDKLVVMGSVFNDGFNKLYGRLPNFSNQNIVGTGWSCNSPWNQVALDKFAVKNLNTEMFSREDIVLIGLPYKELSAFVKEHYGIDAKFEKLPGTWRAISPYVAINKNHTTH